MHAFIKSKDKTRLKRRFGSIALTMVSSLALVACGGGGSTPPQVTAPEPQTPPPPPPPRPDPEDFRTDEYLIDWGKDAIGAAEAYAEGYTGEGQIIGVVDFGFDNFQSSEVNYSSLSRNEDTQFREIYEEIIGEAPSDTHGDAVSVVAAGIKNDVDGHGVAYNAEIIGVEFFSGVERRTEVFQGDTYIISDAYGWLARNGARVINKSIGFDEGDEVDVPNNGGSGGGGNTFYILDLDINAIIEGSLLVSSAGNNSDPEPSLSNIQTIDRIQDYGLATDGDGAFIIVGALSENLELADFSDAAGDYADYYMVAPGDDLVFPYNGDLVIGGGTSFAAPMVAGAAAILFERWPELTAREVRQILFDTATDLGADGPDPIFGQGMLNLAEAINPQGQTSVVLPSIANVRPAGGAVSVANVRTGATITSSALILPAAFGDASGVRNLASNVTIFDTYGRDFQTDLSSQILTRPAVNSLAMRFNMQSQQQIGSDRLAGFGAVASISVNNTEFSLNPTHIGRSIGEATLQGQQRISFMVSGELKGIGKPATYQAGRGFGLSQVMSPLEGTGLQLSQTGQDPYAVGDAFFGVARADLGDGLSLTVGGAAGEILAPEQDLANPQAQAPINVNAPYSRASARVDYATGEMRMGVSVGVMQEEDSLLGSRFAGGLSLGNAFTTSHMGVDASYYFSPNWLIQGELVAGMTDSGNANLNTVLQMDGAIISTSGSFALIGQQLFNPTDRFSLSVAQPLRVEDARVQFLGATGRNDEGLLQFDNRSAALVPTGREIVLETSYGFTWGSFELAGGMAHRFDAGHIQGLNDTQVLMTISRRF